MDLNGNDSLSNALYIVPNEGRNFNWSETEGRLVYFGCDVPLKRHILTSRTTPETCSNETCTQEPF